MKKFLSWLLIACMVFSMFPMSVFATDEGTVIADDAGDATDPSTENAQVDDSTVADTTVDEDLGLKGAGTEADPYLIENYDDLVKLGTLVNGGEDFADKYVALTSDIDLTGKVWTPIGTSNYDKTPAEAKKFAGTFDGKNHTITGLTSVGYVPSAEDTGSTEYSFGLFGYAYGANFKNVKFADVKIECGNRTDSAGKTVCGSGNAALVGYYVPANEKKSVIDNCHVLGGTISASNNMGGLIGHMDSQLSQPEVDITISNCSNAADVTTEAREAGGILGLMNSAREEGNYYVTMRGVVTFKNCINTGAITSLGGGAPSAGGILGRDHNQAAGQRLKVIFDGCENSGLITVTANGETHAAGIGAGYYSAGAWLIAKDCKNTGDVVVINHNSHTYAGGLISYGGVVELINSTSTGSVTGTNKYVGGAQNILFLNRMFGFVDEVNGYTYHLIGGVSPEYAALVDDAAGGGNFHMVETAYKYDENGNPVEFLGWHDANGVKYESLNEGVKHYYAKWNEYVAKIGDSYYSSLAEAINNANEGDVITLLSEIILSDSITIDADKVITLDLNGKSISQIKACTESYSMIENKGSLTIIDSVGDGKISFMDKGAGDPTFGWGSYTLTNRGTLVVAGGTIENLSAQNTATAVKHMYCAIQQSAGSTTINGGTISTNNYRSVRVNKGDLIINGGEFNGQIWLQPNQGDTTLTVTGGTFAPAGKDSSSIFMTNVGENYTVSSAVISGGTFTTKIGASVPAALAGAITGGKFSAAAKNGTNVALLGADLKFGAEANADGYYTLTNKVYVAEVNGVKYESLKEALNACTKGEVIEIIADITYDADDVVYAHGGATGFGNYDQYNPSIIYVGGTKGATPAENQPSNVNAVIDLKGHTITNNANAYLFLIMDNAKVTFDDSVGSGAVINNNENYPVIWACGTDTLVTVKGGLYQTASALGLIHSTHSGDLVIEGGHFSTTADDASLLLMINSQKYNNPNYFLSGVATLTVKGGTFVGFNPKYVGDDYGASSVEDIKFVDGCADGYVPVDNGDGTYGVEEWNGETISNVYELLAFAEKVNSGTDLFVGKTVKLTADINLAGLNWTPIGNDTNYFWGTFDGQEHIISNMTIDMESTGNVYAGLFGCVKKATIKNLTIKDANISVVAEKAYVGAVVGIAHSDSVYETTAKLNFENITVDGCVINAESKSNSAYVGGFVGYCYPANMTDISVSNLTLNPKAANTTFAGGLVGYMQGQNIYNNGNTRAYYTVDTFNLENITIKSETRDSLIGGFAGYTYYGYITLKNATIDGFKVEADVTDSALIGGLVGLAHRSDKGNTFTNVEITGIDFDVVSDSGYDVILGGVVGYSGSPITYSDCSVSGTINESTRGTTSSAFVGGFAGQVASWSPSFVDCSADVAIEASSNHVGGFAGCVSTNSTYTDCSATMDPFIGYYYSGTLTNNRSYVASVGTAYYADFANAVAAAKAGDVKTIVLHAPVVITEDTTLDLAGLTVDGNGVYPAFRIQNGANVTVKGGEVTNSDYVFVLGASDGSSAGNLTIESGSYTGETTVASVTKGTLTINGGEFAIDEENAYNYAYVLNCIDANYKDGSAKIVVKGGTFKNFNPADNAAEGTGTNFVADDFRVIELEENVFTVKTAVYEIYTWEDLKALDAIVEGGDMLEGATVLLMNDINLYEMGDGGEPVTFNPIGANKAYFKGTFDGQGHTIKNMYQSGWALGYDWYNYGTIGLFAYLWDATVKNLTIENAETFVEGGCVGAIAGSAWGDCTFENITVKNSKIATYNNRAGGIVGYTGGTGTFTFKNITVDENTVIAGLWGSFDSSLGGIMGQLQSDSDVVFENVNVACRLDAYNDVTASYKYYAYRMCGMLIGRIAVDANNKPILENVEIGANVNVTFGDWAHYTYINNNVNGYGWQRVEEGYTYGGASITEYPEANVSCLPFTSLVGGQQYGSYGASEIEGVNVTFVAEAAIGATKYWSLADALAAAKDGETVTLLKDVTVYDEITVSGEKKVTLDLNEKTITGYNVYPVIRVQGDADVTVKNGTIKNDDYVFVLGASDGSSAGNLTIESGSYTGETTVASVTKGTLTINGGEFSISDVEAYNYAYLLNCIDANYKDGSAKIVVKGGTFYKFNPENNAAEGQDTDFCAVGYVAKDNGDDTYTVTAETLVTVKVEAIPGVWLTSKITVENWADLAAALGENTNLPVKVTFEKDVTLPETLVIKGDKKVTIDLNGNTVSGMLEVHCDVVVTDTSVDGDGKIDGGSAAAIDNYGTLTVNAGAYTGAMCAIYNNSGATLTIDGGEFTAPGDYYATIENREGTLEVNGGKITATNNAAYAIVDTMGTTTINGGEIVSANGTAVETYDGTIVINDGTFTGKVIVENQAGNVSVYGGTLVSNTPEYYYGLTIANGGNTVLYGGTYERDYATAEGTSVKIDKDHKSVANGDGTYSVVEKVYVAQIGEVKYETLADAIKEAQKGDTITLLANITENVTIKQNLTIDGAKFDYTGTMTANSGLTVTVQNVNFVNGGFAKTAKSSDGNYTFKDCTFDGGNGSYYYALSFSGAGTVNVENCTVADYMYSFLYVKNGTNTVSVKNVTVEDCPSYAVYFSSGVNNATFENLTVKNSNNGFVIDNTVNRAFTIKNCKMENVASAISESRGTNSITCTALGANDFGTATLSKYATVVLGAVDATLAAPEGYNVTTELDGYAVVYESDKYVVKRVVTVKFDDVTIVAGNTPNYTYTTNFNDVSEDGEMLVVETPEIAINGAGQYEITAKAYVFMSDKYVVDVTAGTLTVTEAVAKIGNTFYATLAEAIEKAKTGDTITLLADITENVTIDRNLTIDGAKFDYTGTMTANSGLTVTVQNVNFVNGGFDKSTKSSKGQYTIKNCTFDGSGTYAYAFRFKGANTITIEDCTVKNYLYSFLYVTSSTNTVSVKNVTVEDCPSYAVYFASGVTSATFENLTVKNSNNGFVINNAANRKFTIKNCTMENVASAISESSGTYSITCTAFGANDFGTATLSEYATVVLGAVDATLAAPAGANVGSFVEYYGVVYENGVYSLENIAVAQIEKDGEVKYFATLADAIEKAEPGDVVTLIRDIDLSKTEPVILDGSYDTYFLVEGKDITVDLNGKTISGEYKGTNTMLVGVFSTDNGGHLTLTGNGTVDVTATNTVYSLIANYEDGCSIVIENGTYKLDKAKDCLVYSGCNTSDGYDDGEIEQGILVKGGNFELGNVGTGTNGKPWIFNVLGGSERHVVVTGGTFNSDVSNQFWFFEVEIPADHYCKNNRNGTWTVDKYAVAAVYRVIDKYELWIGYATVADALEAASKINGGTTVKLLSDTEEAYVVVYPNVTLDLNGYDLKATYVVGFNGSNVVDSSADKSGRLIANKNNVVLDKANDMLPIYDGTGYAFVAISFNNASGSNRYAFSNNKYSFAPLLGENAVARALSTELLGEGFNASNVKVVVRVTWSKDGEYTATQDFAYLDEMLGDYVDSLGAKKEDKYASMLTATFSTEDMKDATDVTVSAVIISETGVEVEGGILPIDVQ